MRFDYSHWKGPRPEDIDMTGLRLQEGAMDKLLEVHRQDWNEELKGIRKFFGQFKRDLPRELWDEFRAQEIRLKS